MIHWIRPDEIRFYNMEFNYMRLDGIQSYWLESGEILLDQIIMNQMVSNDLIWPQRSDEMRKDYMRSDYTK